MKKAKANERGLVRRKKTAEVEVLEPVEDELYKNVRSIIVKARAKVYAAANTALVKAYWDVGREIVEKQGGEARSRYGDGLVARLSLKLTAEFGPGYNKVNLFYMRRFFLAFPKVHTLCKQLNWSHFRTLITIEDAKKRQFYLTMSICSDPFIPRKYWLVASDITSEGALPPRSWRFVRAAER